MTEPSPTPPVIRSHTPDSFPEEPLPAVPAERKKQQMNKAARLTLLAGAVFCLLLILCLFVPYVRIETTYRQRVYSYGQLSLGNNELVSEEILPILLVLALLGLAGFLLPLFFSFHKPGRFLWVPLFGGLCTWAQTNETQFLFFQETFQNGAANILRKFLSFGLADNKKLLFIQEPGARLLPVICLVLILLSFLGMYLLRQKAEVRFPEELLLEPQA